MLTKDRRANTCSISVGSHARSYTVPIVEKFVERVKAVREWSASQRQGTDLIVQPKPACTYQLPRRWIRCQMLLAVDPWAHVVDWWRGGASRATCSHVQRKDTLAASV